MLKLKAISYTVIVHSYVLINYFKNASHAPMAIANSRKIITIHKIYIM